MAAGAGWAELSVGVPINVRTAAVGFKQRNLAMVVGLDIDGTITRHPRFFAFISQALLQGGHRLVVITFREDRNSAAEDLEAWKLIYSELVTWSFQENGEENMYAW
jgi:hypothetical protein